MIRLPFAFYAMVCLCLNANALPGDNIAGRPFAEAVADAHWRTYPQDGSITVIGIAGRKRNQDEAVAEALADAARKISLYYGVSGQSVTILNEAQNALDYFFDSDYQLTIHHEPEEYAESLVFDRKTDVAEKNGAVYVRVRYGAAPDIASGASTQADTPVWNGKGVPPWMLYVEIPGWLVSAGCSKSRGTAQNTHRASYENAIAALLPQLSARVETSVVETTGGAKITRNTARGKGALTNVLILETFYNKATGELWTLIAAKEGKDKQE